MTTDEDPSHSRAHRPTGRHRPAFQRRVDLYVLATDELYLVSEYGCRHLYIIGFLEIKT